MKIDVYIDESIYSQLFGIMSITSKTRFIINAKKSTFSSKLTTIFSHFLVMKNYVISKFFGKLIIISQYI